MQSLDEIGKKYGTDKASGAHDYLSAYEHCLYPLRDAPAVKLLEIGVQTGGSLRMWEEWFDDPWIVGLDIDPKCAFSEGRILSVTTDFREWTPPQKQDVIIDDGSHLHSDVADAVNALFPYLADDGMYFVEDMFPYPIDSHDWIAKIHRACEWHWIHDNLCVFTHA